jgi:hypothetical protein
VTTAAAGLTRPADAPWHHPLGLILLQNIVVALGRKSARQA